MVALQMAVVVMVVVMVKMEMAVPSYLVQLQHLPAPSSAYRLVPSDH